MFVHPRVGDSARQEYLKGEAEDHFQVVAIGVERDQCRSRASAARC